MCPRWKDILRSVKLILELINGAMIQKKEQNMYDKTMTNNVCYESQH